MRSRAEPPNQRLKLAPRAVTALAALRLPRFRRYPAPAARLPTALTSPGPRQPGRSLGASREAAAVVNSPFIELLRVDHTQRPDLRQLVDSYLEELNVYRDHPAAPRNAANYRYLPSYWEDPSRHPFFLLAKGKRVGFALVRRLEEKEVTEMSEFYVCPDSRRAGVGRAALVALFRLFPGAWQLQVLASNQSAVAFWSKCIRELASGSVLVADVREEDGWRRQFRFEVAAA